MLSKGQISHLKSLRLAKFREESGEYIAEGGKLAIEMLSARIAVTGIYALSGWISHQQALLGGKESLVHEIDEQELSRISNMVSPQDVVVTARLPEPVPARWEDLKGPLLVLDRIQDPGNLGTIIRCADWFGFPHIVCSEGTADLYNPKVIQATMGSFLRVSLHYTSLDAFLKAKSADRTVLGSYAGGENVFVTDFGPDPVILVGNESRGIAESLGPFIDRRIGIPSFSGSAESLNASVAAAILMAEFRRGQSSR